jgi:hypothetical protein
MSDIIRFIAKQLAGEPPKMNRREFLRRSTGAAAAAAMPKWLAAAEAAAPAAKAVQFVDDPKMLTGFTGLSTYGVDPGNKYSMPFWFEGDWPDSHSMSGPEIRGWLKRNLGVNPHSPSDLPYSLSQGVPRNPATPEANVDPNWNIGHYAWNKYTRQWHPVVALPTDRPNVTQIRYLEPGSAVPDNALDWQYWVDHAPNPHDGMEQFFKTPAGLAEDLLSDWRKGRMWEFKEKGLDRKELSQDPELAKQYVEHAKRKGLAPGGRYEQSVDLAPPSPRRREFDLPLDLSVQPDEPPVTRSNFRKYGPWAPALLAPAAADENR